MTVTTYLSPIEQHTDTSDHHINELVVEVNEKTGLHVVVHEQVYITKKLFRKEVEHKFYTVYIRVHDSEYQIINFYDPTSGSSINLTITPVTISAYLYGILVGNTTIKK